MEQLNVSELGFLFNAAYMGGFAMAVYVPLTLYMNYRFLPDFAKTETDFHCHDAESLHASISASRFQALSGKLNN